MHAEVLDHIKFGILSPEQIKQLSVAKLTVPDTYNEDGYPIDGGLLDQRLGVIDPGLICKTCGGRAQTCPGHFGHIELTRPVVHSEFSKIIYMLLQTTCQQCHRTLLNDDQILTFQDKFKKVVNIEGEDITNAIEKLEERDVMVKKIRNIKKCPHCGSVQQKIKFSSPTYFYIGEKKPKPDELRDMLSKISDHDLELLGIDPRTSRPEWLIISQLLVALVNVRPSITLESGERSEDDLTHKLVDIMRINQRLEQNINAGAPQIIIDDLWELLQYHVTTYFNNETSGIPPARHRSGRALKTLAQRLKGKEGRFRYNLSGKRVNYSARTVISADPYIHIGDVGVPRDIASKLTVPFYVTEWNIETAKKLLEKTTYPMVLNIISRDGKRKRILDTNREEILKIVQVGDILERQLIDGDIALFNRQPSLHRVSIMAHKVKVVPGKTFRLNYCATAPYNADFDGDEMNLHIPQTLEAQAEAKYLMEVKDQVFSPRDGGAIISNSEDGVTGMYLLTKEENRLTKDEATFILGLAGVFELPKVDKDGTYKGRDIFSMLLPKGLDFETKTKSGMTFRIKDGKLVEGNVISATFGRGAKLYVKIGKDYGSQELIDFIFRTSKVSEAYATIKGVTVGVKDYMVNQKIADERIALLENTFKKVDDLIVQYKTRKLQPLIGYTLRQSLEKMIIAELDVARRTAESVLSKYEGEENHALLMSKAGRGSMLNLEQMSMFLGQQATLSSGRIKRGYYSGRVLPHIAPRDIRPQARGFVVSNYTLGLDPIGLFMHAVGSRGAEVFKALLTARSGYLYRRLSNALQDYYVQGDGSVRDASNNMVETIYGGDLIDPIKTQYRLVE